jgi:hypothetical protein
VILRVAAYIQQWNEIKQHSNASTVPREKWSDFDPQLIAEGLFAAANIFSALKIVHLFSINPHLGPLQVHHYRFAPLPSLPRAAIRMTTRKPLSVYSILARSILWNASL